MAIPIIICDDSSMARKQMWRALPTDWDFEVSFATNGQEALESVKQGKGIILFLDLTMPVMDGFEVLETLQQESNSIKTIVVSGDIQPESYSRVMSMGAVAFIKKPFDPMLILDVLDPLLADYNSGGIQESPPEVQFSIGPHDIYRELMNVAMGRAANLLAKHLNAFVVMPIPYANMMNVHELQMAIDHTASAENTFAVCQGFISSEISGEALSIFTGTDFKDLADLLNYDGEVDEIASLELATDISSILVGAILKSLSEQIDITFCQGLPVVLGHKLGNFGAIKIDPTKWEETLAIEMFFTVENKNIYCDFIIVFNSKSIDALKQRLSFLTE